MKTKLLHLSTSTRLILCLSAALPLCVKSFADEPATNAQIVAETEQAGEIVAETEQAGEIVAETLFEDGTTNTWTAADLTGALGLMNRKYHRDIKTESGRMKWHGKRMGQYLLAAENGKECLVMLYEDGFAWTNAAQRIGSWGKDPEAAAKAKAAAEARQAEWERTHLPPDVAALLQRRRDAANGIPLATP